MRALMRQELRAHLHWGALCLFACALAMGYAVTSFDLAELAPSEVPLTSGIMFLATVLGSALTGFTLGLVQMAPEMAPGRWALLVHRPLSRARIFWSKAVVGLLLYAVAVGAPFALVVWWSATHVPAPFDGRLALGGVVNLLGGIACYFAALLVALRPSARWLGSRALPLATALSGTYLATAATELWQALSILLVVVVLLAVSAWGAFIGGGSLRRPRVARACFALGLLLGLYGVACGLGLTSTLTGDDDLFHRFYALSDGRIVDVTKDWPRGDIKEVVDVATGNRLPAPSRLPYPLKWYALQTASRGTFRAAARVFLPFRSWETSKQGVFWYYVHDSRQIVGYEKKSGRLAGRIGRRGFRGTVRYLDSSWLVLDTAAYRLDLEARTIRKVADAMPGSFISATASPFLDAEDAEAELLLATRDAVHFVNEKGERRLSLPLTGKGDRPESFGIARIEDRTAWWRTWGDYLVALFPSSPKAPTLIRYHKDGRLKRRFVVPFVEPDEPPPVHTLIAGLFPSSVAGDLLLRTGYPLPRWWPRWWRVALLHALALWSVVGFSICLWITRRYRLPPTARALWALCGLTFGLAGILVLLASHEWPARLPCHRCGKPRCVNLATCPHCGAPLPGPERDGTEILAHAC